MTAQAEHLRLSLRFLSGKNQGSEYVLADPSVIVVGRSAEADLILVEGMVSRAHARFELSEGEVGPDPDDEDQEGHEIRDGAILDRRFGDIQGAPSRYWERATVWPSRR